MKNLIRTIVVGAALAMLSGCGGSGSAGSVASNGQKGKVSLSIALPPASRLIGGAWSYLKIQLKDSSKVNVGVATIIKKSDVGAVTTANYTSIDLDPGLYYLDVDCTVFKNGSSTPNSSQDKVLSQKIDTPVNVVPQADGSANNVSITLDSAARYAVLQLTDNTAGGSPVNSYVAAGDTTLGGALTSGHNYTAKFFLTGSSAGAQAATTGTAIQVARTDGDTTTLSAASNLAGLVTLGSATVTAAVADSVGTHSELSYTFTAGNTSGTADVTLSYADQGTDNGVAPAVKTYKFKLSSAAVTSLNSVVLAGTTRAKGSTVNVSVPGTLSIGDSAATLSDGGSQTVKNNDANVAFSTSDPTYATVTGTTINILRGDIGSTKDITFTVTYTNPGGSAVTENVTLRIPAVTVNAITSVTIGGTPFANGASGINVNPGNTSVGGIQASLSDTRSVFITNADALFSNVPSTFSSSNGNLTFSGSTLAAVGNFESVINIPNVRFGYANVSPPNATRWDSAVKINEVVVSSLTNVTFNGVATDLTGGAPNIAVAAGSPVNLTLLVAALSDGNSKSSGFAGGGSYPNNTRLTLAKVSGSGTVVGNNQVTTAAAGTGTFRLTYSFTDSNSVVHTATRDFTVTAS